jgi:hypothetical protein
MCFRLLFVIYLSPCAISVTGLMAVVPALYYELNEITFKLGNDKCIGLPETNNVSKIQLCSYSVVTVSGTRNFISHNKRFVLLD